MLSSVYCQAKENTDEINGIRTKGLQRIKGSSERFLR